MTTVTLEVNNPSALNLMHLLNKLGVVEILKENEEEPANTGIEMSDMLKDTFLKENVENLKRHVEEMCTE